MSRCILRLFTACFSGLGWRLFGAQGYMLTDCQTDPAAFLYFALDRAAPDRGTVRRCSGEYK